jgi:hypothetical protein
MTEHEAVFGIPVVCANTRSGANKVVLNEARANFFILK